MANLTFFFKKQIIRLDKAIVMICLPDLLTVFRISNIDINNLVRIL